MQRQHFFKYISCFLLLFLFNISAKTVHPFFISVTEIRSDSAKKSMNIACKMFTDDLQQALLKLYQHKADLEKGDNSSAEFLQKYISERLSVTVNGQPVSFRFAGYETEDEATWCYLEAVAFPGDGKVEISNGLLYDFIEGQTNLVHFYRDGKRNSGKLVNPNRVIVF